MAFTSMNPSTQEVVKKYPPMTWARACDLIHKSSGAYDRWRRITFSQRSSFLTRAAQLLRERIAEFAQLMALEMGKPLSEGEGEVQKCAWVCEYYAEQAEVFLQTDTVSSDAAKSFVAYEPLGPVLAIMPWNFPFWQVFRFAAPALMAGNTILLKHAPNVTGCALAIEQLMIDAGFPTDVLQVLLAEEETVSRAIAQPEIKAVTLTGSTRAGRSVAEVAGRHLKKVVLELGGSDPYLILADAHVEAAAKACVTSRLINGGQSCIAAKRFIVDQTVVEEFTRIVHDLMKAKTFGNPQQGTFDIGPMAREDLRDDLHRQVRETIEAGAECLLGGEVPERQGWFYPPSLLTNIPENSPAFREELFGPVVAIITAKDQAEAVRLANQSDYGLGAAVFTRDREKGEQLAREELESGACFVNDFVRSDPRLPFGGIKNSGYGRELSIQGIREFVNVKTIWVK